MTIAECPCCGNSGVTKVKDCPECRKQNCPEVAVRGRNREVNDGQGKQEEEAGQA